MPSYKRRTVHQLDAGLLTDVLRPSGVHVHEVKLRDDFNVALSTHVQDANNTDGWSVRLHLVQDHVKQHRKTRLEFEHCLKDLGAVNDLDIDLNYFLTYEGPAHRLIASMLTDVLCRHAQVHFHGSLDTMREFGISIRDTEVYAFMIIEGKPSYGIYKSGLTIPKKIVERAFILPDEY